MFDRLLRSRQSLAAAWRRSSWVVDNLTPRKTWNVLLCLAQYSLKRQSASGWPLAVKVDISPLCNLRCTVCVHARSGTEETEIEDQSFNRSQMMSLEDFRRIVDELKGKTSAISMYYLGDPLMHPQLDRMCRAAAEAGINTHVSTNLSFKLSDERLKGLVESGLTHLTVCVDGLSQELYARTRIGGRIELVFANLKRILEIRRQLGQKYPRVEVQYIKFQHNLAEIEPARRIFREIGVDYVTEFFGSLARAWHSSPPAEGKGIVAKPNKRSPRCFWPHFSMQIKYNGDVIPCCTYRQTAQYGNGDARIIGNVFATSVQEVWKSEAYAKLRLLVNKPASVGNKEGSKSNFCYGCDAIYDVDPPVERPRGDKHAWEDYFSEDRTGKVLPKPGSYKTMTAPPR